MGKKRLFVATEESRNILARVVDQFKKIPKNAPTRDFFPLGENPEVFIAVPPCGEGIPGRVGDEPGWKECCIFKLTDVVSGGDDVPQPTLEALKIPGEEGDHLREIVYNIYPEEHLPVVDPHTDGYIVIQKDKSGRWLCERAASLATQEVYPEIPIEDQLYHYTQRLGFSITEGCGGECKWEWDGTAWELIDGGECEPDVAGTTTTAAPTTTTEAPTTTTAVETTTTSGGATTTTAAPTTTTTSCGLCPPPTTTTSSGTTTTAAPTTTTIGETTTTADPTTTTTPAPDPEPLPCRCLKPQFDGKEVGECVKTGCVQPTECNEVIPTGCVCNNCKDKKASQFFCVSFSPAPGQYTGDHPQSYNCGECCTELANFRAAVRQIQYCCAWEWTARMERTPEFEFANPPCGVAFIQARIEPSKLPGEEGKWRASAWVNTFPTSVHAVARHLDMQVFSKLYDEKPKCTSRIEIPYYCNVLEYPSLGNLHPCVGDPDDPDNLHWPCDYRNVKLVLEPIAEIDDCPPDWGEECNADPTTTTTTTPDGGTTTTTAAPTTTTGGGGTTTTDPGASPCSTCSGDTPAVMSVSLVGLTGGFSGSFNGVNIAVPQDVENACKWDTGTLVGGPSATSGSLTLTLTRVVIERYEYGGDVRTSIDYTFTQTGAVGNVYGLSFDDATAPADCTDDASAAFESEGEGLGMWFTSTSSHSNYGPDS